MLPMPAFYRGWLLADRRRLGRWGERKARALLRRKGHRFVAKNYRCESGEIDLIMEGSGRTLVFVEVKTRKDERFAPAQFAVGHRKRKRIIRMARQFCRKYKLNDRTLRFDVVAVVLPPKGTFEIRHYENAFRVS